MSDAFRCTRKCVALKAMAERREDSALSSWFSAAFRCFVAVLLCSVCPHGSGVSGSESDPFWAGSSGLSETAAAARDVRYLLYDVNPPEGFNLRRDVYIRMASLVKTLRQRGDWVLVLPPWGRLYHWQSPDMHQVQIPWGEFFSISSLQANIPVIEYEEFIAESGGPFINQVLVLQNYAEGWKEGAWEEKVDERPCIERLMYDKDKQGYYRGWFWGYEETRALNVTCVSAQGHASVLAPYLLENLTATSVMLDRAETVLHDHYAGKDYWNTRRSMVFAKHLRVLGDQFRAQYLNSTDKLDHTPYNEDWTRMKAKLGSAKGGPYLGAHLRRKDFIWGHREDVPSLKGAVKKIRSLMKKHKLEKVFIASDADEEEMLKLKKLLPEMVRYEPSRDELKLLKDGGVAIIDQWICAHARSNTPPSVFFLRFFFLLLLLLSSNLFIWLGCLFYFFIFIIYSLNFFVFLHFIHPSILSLSFILVF